MSDQRVYKPEQKNQQPQKHKGQTPVLEKQPSEQQPSEQQPLAQQPSKQHILKQWLVKDNDNIIGPFTKGQIQEKLTQGKLSPAVMACLPDQACWVFLINYPEFISWADKISSNTDITKSLSNFNTTNRVMFDTVTGTFSLQTHPYDSDATPPPPSPLNSGEVTSPSQRSKKEVSHKEVPFSASAVTKSQSTSNTSITNKKPYQSEQKKHKINTIENILCAVFFIVALSGVIYLLVFH